MVDHRKELSEEVLGFDFNPSLKRMNAFLGVCLGYMFGSPLFAVIVSFTFLFPAVNIPKDGYFYFLGISSVVGSLWGYLAGTKYDGFSVRFNKEFVTLYKDRIAKQQIYWADVVPLKRSWNTVIQTRQGLSIEIPMMVMRGESYEVRSLRNHLSAYVELPKERNAIPWMVWGAVLVVGGIAVLVPSPKPKEVFADSDPSLFSTWLRVLPAILGGVASQIGVIALLVGISLQSARKKPSPYVLTDEGISKKDKRLLWSDLVAINRTGSQDMLLRLVPKKGRSWEINCRSLINGEQVRDAILVHAPEPKAVQRVNCANKTIVAELGSELRASIIFLGIFSLALVAMAVGSIGFHWLSARPQDPPVLGYLCALTALLLGIPIFLVWKKTTLNGEELASRWIIGFERSIRLSEIQSVEIKTVHSKDRTVDVLTVKSAKSKLGISSSFSNYPELRDALLATVPEGKVRLS